jgi:hypothetical protein
LSFLCNKSIRDDVNDALNYAYSIFYQNSYKRIEAKEEIKRCQTEIEFYEYRISQIPHNTRTKYNGNFTDASYRLNNARIALAEAKQIY